MEWKYLLAFAVICVLSILLAMGILDTEKYLLLIIGILTALGLYKTYKIEKIITKMSGR